MSTPQNVRHPDIDVQLSNDDGNAFSIIARVVRALGRAGVSQDEVRRYQEEAMSGDYEHLLQVTAAWVHVR